MMTDDARPYNFKHGYGETRIYGVWSAMIRRCEVKADSGYHKYGGRGITVCERWHDIINFIADTGEQPAGKSLDRINNDGPYCPENCRWVTPMEQGSNTRQNLRMTHRGETRHLSEWARHIGISLSGLRNRLRLGWTLDAALSTPVNTALRNRNYKGPDKPATRSLLSEE